MSSFLDEIKNKLKEGRTELKIISGGGKESSVESSGSSSNHHWIWGLFFFIVILIVIVVVVVVLSNKTDENPNLIQMDKEKEDPEEIPRR